MGLLNVHVDVIVYLLLLLPKIDSSLEYESGDITHEKEKYFREENDLYTESSKWDKYIKLIEKAEENHKNQTDGNNQSIFHNQIDLDFSYWKNQPMNDIQKQLNNMESIAKTHRLTLYQII
ncbi:unnamed protein product [Rotaria sp. Silwood2]|nr:unnamed protein product [Rotaria sp. Silwood2]CAF4827163.1 unnamed protein product [Rotaria sp. Silwood2]